MNKMLGIYCLSVSIPVLFFGVYYTTNTYHAMMDEAANQSAVINSRICDRLDELTFLISNVSDKIANDAELKRLILHQYENYSEVVRTYRNYTALDDFIIYYPQIDSIMLYVDNVTMLNNGHFTFTTDDMKGADWYSQAANGSAGLTWACVPDNFTKYYNMSLVRKLNLDNSGHYAILTINISNSYLSSLSRDENTKAYFFVNGDTIVFAPRRREVGDVYESLETGIPFEQLREPQILTAEEEQARSIAYMTSLSPNKSNSPIQIMTVFPIDDSIKPSQAKLTAGLLITAALISLSLVIVFLFSRNISRRIVNIRGEMHKAVQGDFNITRAIACRDEIGDLHEDLVLMIDSIQKLMREIYEEKLQKEQMLGRQKEVEYKMLTSQINPHFLFNTLETIRMKALVNNDREVAQAILILGKNMRHIMQISNSEVTLASELDQVRSYLDIQKFRFGEKVEYRITVDYNIDPGHYYILPLLVQPLVENAFVHGLEAMERGGTITLELYKDGDELAISVSDNGVGLEEETLSALIAQMNDEVYSPGKSIGLCNVHQRIKLYYGKEYGLQIESRQGHGTAVTMHLPLTGKVANHAEGGVG